MTSAALPASPTMTMTGSSGEAGIEAEDLGSGVTDWFFEAARSSSPAFWTGRSTGAGFPGDSPVLGLLSF